MHLLGINPKYQYYHFISQQLCFVLLFLSFMASIWSPGFLPVPWMYIARTHLDGAVTTIQTSEGLSHNVSEIRFSMWGICYYSEKERTTCRKINNHHVIISRGKNVAVVDWANKWPTLLVQPIVTSVSGFVIFINVIILWWGAFYFYPRENPYIERYMAFMECPGYLPIRMASTLALAVPAICNTTFLQLIQSKLHELGVTEIGLGFKFSLISSGLLAVLCFPDMYHFRYIWKRSWARSRQPQKTVIGTEEHVKILNAYFKAGNNSKVPSSEYGEIRKWESSPAAREVLERYKPQKAKLAEAE